MTAAVFTLAVTLLGAVGCLVWMARGLVSAERAAAHAEADVAIAAKDAAIQTAALDEMRDTNARLQGVIDELLRTAPPLGAGLADDDVAGRVRRLAAEARAHRLSDSPRDGVLDPAAAE